MATASSHVRLMHSNCIPLNRLTKEKIYAVRNGKSVHLDVKAELCAGCGVCVKACPYDVIRLSGKGEMVPTEA